MPRFQSRLFNWIDQSLPAKLGRSARRLIDRQLRQMPSVKDLPRLLAYQVAKAALYPVYLIASTTKRIFPALGRSKTEDREKLRSQPKSVGLLSESEANTENIEQVIEQELPKPEITPEIPLLLRPLVKFLNWIDRTKLKLDRNIAAIVKRQPDNLANIDNPELEPRIIANRIFAEIWQQQVEQRQAEENALKENNGLAENVALGKNRSLEQLRRLIEAAIAYFFGHGNQANAQVQNLASDEELTDLSGTESDALPSSPKLGRRRVKSTGAIKENSPLTQNTNLERLRELIAAAIAYFIGKRVLDGDEVTSSDVLEDFQEKASEFLSGEATDKLQTSSQESPNKAKKSSSENSDELKFDDQLERLQRLIAEAIAYFFGRQLSQPTLDETSDIAPSEEAWLTMEDVFGDDNGPWPLPLEYESHAFTKSQDMTAINSSGELQSFETTTTQISQDRIEGSLLFEEETLAYQNSTSDTENERPLRAWIEAKATLLGYVYNPVMTVIFWLDAIILKIENFFIRLWKGLINLPKRLVDFIRYGNKKSK
ncbi:hypothetical protein [Pseudanabaena sp. ABRG5-3]|uniref:hypothetical protein n=1 Tax=Pseudanabaena sp. ABRG5-3 TaxID=685565 RepID=UPI000DC6F2D7|nr:hypothetical protein [Pseudanabaena sp. ABRG5-3]BBC23927.1 hypothetical protein ABRG53_1670 [Pseudanabaena sp. ABRG5-3]